MDQRFASAFGKSYEGRASLHPYSARTMKKLRQPRQTHLWNPEAEIAARDRGMALAAAKNSADLEIARTYARRVARRTGGLVDIDGVRAALEADGCELIWGNWAGSVFKDPLTWAPAGIKRCIHPGGHARLIRIWKLRE